METECTECKKFDEEANKRGHSYGMCKKCFDKSFVFVNLPYQPDSSKREESLMNFRPFSFVNVKEMQKLMVEKYKRDMRCSELLGD